MRIRQAKCEVDERKLETVVYSRRAGVGAKGEMGVSTSQPWGFHLERRDVGIRRRARQGEMTEEEAECGGGQLQPDGWGMPGEINLDLRAALDVQGD